MDDAGYEAAIAEYAEIEARLRNPAVLRDFRLARRLRRQLEWLESLPTTAVDDTPRDPYDPYDAVVRITAPLADCDAQHLACALLSMYQEYARRRGWEAELLFGEPDTGHVTWATVAIMAGEGGEGVWSALKRETGRHRDGRTGGLADVLVAPDEEASAPLPGGEEDWRIDLMCTRQPDAPSAIRITHLPSGSTGWGRSADHREARGRALREVRAELLVRRLGLAEPGGAPVRTYDLSRGTPVLDG